MECVADYEIKAEGSVVADNQVLRIKHPKGLYRARIVNVSRLVYTTPFLLSLHLYFDAPNLDESQEVADNCLADCLNMLAFVTGMRFQKHRIRQIVDATPNLKGMRSLHKWGEKIEYDDPQPFLDEHTARAIERLTEFDIPQAIRRAMRWYRLGINETVPDDQFACFWFALEIVAEFQKSSEKVPDKCPKCQSPLYCEVCKTHPTHRPFARQAIQALLKSADKDCKDETIELLFKTRNSLMHGLTLKEIEDRLPKPHEQIVDVLGRLLWMALIHQFPREMFDGKISLGFPSTYVHYSFNAVGKIQTVVPVGADGDFILSNDGVHMEVVPFGPPQSALPTEIRMSIEQKNRLAQLSFTKGDHREMCLRIHQRTEVKKGVARALVLSTDMAMIQDALKKGESGIWQDLFREIMEGANGT